MRKQGASVSHASRGTWYALFLVLALSVVQCRPAHSEAEALLAEACGYLWGVQGEDGGWHSATHGLLRSGQAWTPFVLHALLGAPGDLCGHRPQALARALTFIRRHVNEAGALGLADPDLLEYPNYATAYALRVLAAHGEASDERLIAQMMTYLRDQQFAEHRGFEPGTAAYGSWGFGETHLPPGRTGHVDLSHTRRALQALRLAGHDDPATYRRAEAFLRLAQKHPADPRFREAGLDSTIYDGGFFASPVVPGVNKSTPVAAVSLPLYRSYATATCDGLLALLAAGVARDDDRVQAAVRWLRTYDDLAFPEGIPEDHPAQWRRVLVFYHLLVRAEIYDVLGWPGTWRERMVRLLAARQQEDGRFANPYGAANKEDDPVLATAMTVVILSSTLR